MLILIIIMVVIMVAVFLLQPSQNSASPPPNPRPHTPPQRQTQSVASKIQSLYDAGDQKAVPTAQQKDMVCHVRRYQQTRRRNYTAANRETVSIDLSWSENLAELIDATEVVYTNAELNCRQPLVSARFDYYIKLHFRSFTAADLCHNKLEEIRPHYDQINRLIRRLNDRNDPLRVSREEYQQIIQIKDVMKNILAFLRSRRDSLNAQTGIIRDKIRDECGQRGNVWYQNLMNRSGR